MGRIGKIARRTFLVGSIAVAGGVAFGVYKLREEADNPLPENGFDGSLNAFVIINQDGVTLVAPKAEMGQGVQTTWAALIAEELDVAWEQITVIHGPPAQAYYNSALFGGALPFLDYRVGGWQNELRKFAGNGAKLLSLQLTAGSSSMRDGFERMRIAGATAREALKEVAARRLGVSRASLSTKEGYVIGPQGDEIAYADLAGDAADIDPPKVALRDPSEWKYLGRTMPRVDMPDKVTGVATFGIDVRLEGMLFATVRMNPKRAGMKGFDAAKAETMQGVRRVIDLGDGVAVVATNTWLAFRAADEIVFDWEDAAYPETTQALLEPIAAAFETEPNSMARDDGDVDKAHEGQEVTAEYTMPWLAHAAMEPMNATALFDGANLTVWCGNQAPVLTRKACAEAVGIDPEQVTLHTTYMGGAFGRRAETDFSQIAARVAKDMPGVPVQVTWTREEDMQHDFYRPAAIGRFRGVLRGGEISVLDGKLASPSVFNRSAGQDPDSKKASTDREMVAGAYDQPYAIENFRISGYISKSHPPIGYWRSVSSSIPAFFQETFIDELASEAGRDPLELRLDLMRGEHGPSEGVLEAVRDMSQWDTDAGPDRAKGIAFAYTFGTPVAQVVQTWNKDGQIRIEKVWIAADVGRALDPGNLEAQLIGGCLFGLSAAVMGEITFSDGAVEQENFYDYDALRMSNAPAFDVRILENNRFIGGVGEVGVPPAAPALGNALFALTGSRARELPFSKHFSFF